MRGFGGNAHPPLMDAPGSYVHEGLCGRWLVQDVDDPDSGSTISLWATEEALRAYERSDVLKDKMTARLAPFFAGQYATRVSRVRFAEGDPAPSEWLSPLEC